MVASFTSADDDDDDENGENDDDDYDDDDEDDDDDKYKITTVKCISFSVVRCFHRGILNFAGLLLYPFHSFAISILTSMSQTLSIAVVYGVCWG